MAKKRPFKTAEQCAAKWLAAMQGNAAQQAYAAGTANKGGQMVSGAVAAIQSGKTLQGFTQAINNGTMAAALQNPMTSQLYNANTGQKGAQQLGVGAAKKQPKYKAAMQNLQTVWAQMREAAYQLDPEGNRATAAARQNAALAILMGAGKKGTGTPAFP